MLIQLALLALFWLLLGAIVSLITHAAHLQPVSWRICGIVRTASLGATTAFIGGWLGILLLGRPFATATALWVSIVGVVSIPYFKRTLFPAATR